MEQFLRIKRPNFFSSPVRPPQFMFYIKFVLAHFRVGRSFCFAAQINVLYNEIKLNRNCMAHWQAKWFNIKRRCIRSESGAGQGIQCTRARHTDAHKFTFVELWRLNTEWPFRMVRWCIRMSFGIARTRKHALDAINTIHQRSCSREIY